jgi:hypothetical protein
MHLVRRTIFDAMRSNVDLHHSQRRRKGFVGGKEPAGKIGHSPSALTVRGYGGSRFDLTCSFHTLGFIVRYGKACREDDRVRAAAARAAQVFAPK